MAKKVQMSIKMEPELHEQFMAVVATTRTPAVQVLRQLIRRFIAQHEIPNAVTLAAMAEADRGEGKRFDSSDALFKVLSI